MQDLKAAEAKCGVRGAEGSKFGATKTWKPEEPTVREAQKLEEHAREEAQKAEEPTLALTLLEVNP